MNDSEGFMIGLPILFVQLFFFLVGTFILNIVWPAFLLVTDNQDGLQFLKVL